MTCRLVVILPTADADRPQFRRWQAEKSSGPTITKSLGFEDEADAMFIGRALPYVWHVEAERRPA